MPFVNLSVTKCERAKHYITHKMGGMLLKKWNLPEKRVSRADFDRIIEEVMSVLRAHYPEHRIEPLKFFAEKKDFGDLDVAFEIKEGWNIPWRSKIEELFGFPPHRNGNCISFPYEGFQVDILLFESEVFDIAQVYYAYESGNGMGRVADKLDFSYGHRGLYLQVPLDYFNARLPKHEYREILVSRDPAAIFAYLGFDYDRFLKGFRNFEEMARWIADSYYFNPEIFAFESLNSINRVRNKKRPVYAAFVEWCKSQPRKALIPPKGYILKQIASARSDIQEEIAKVRAELILSEKRRAKFNGNQVRDLLGLEDKALGDFIKEFKKAHVVNGSFEEWLDAHSGEEVVQEIIARRK